MCNCIIRCYQEMEYSQWEDTMVTRLVVILMNMAVTTLVNGMTSTPATTNKMPTNHLLPIIEVKYYYIVSPLVC